MRNLKRMGAILMALALVLSLNLTAFAAVEVTAGRDAMSEFAPKFAELNDDVLFGEVWSREDKLSPRDRSLITVSALMASGILDTSLLHHIQRAKANGVTAQEMSEALTQLAFYAGWPKAWAALRMAKEVYGEPQK